MANVSLIKQAKHNKVEMILNTDKLDDEIDAATEEIPELSSLIEFIAELKDISDLYYVQKLLKNNKDLSISSAMVSIYDGHAQDLDDFKKFIREYLPNKYSEVFRKVIKDVNNYPKYIGMNSTKSKGFIRFGHASQEEFYDYAKKIIDSADAPAEKKKYFLDKIENKDFLLRQNSNQNGAFPMQLHLKELKKILENQSKYYPFLKKADNEGKTIIDKLILTFKYKLPYFVGPLNQKSNYSWVVRDNQKITPWNYEKVINMDETAIRFIKRMQNKCTYLKGDEDYCLPKASMIYSKYNCLSYLNKISFNGLLIKKDIKESLFNDVFLTQKQPTRKAINDYLIAHYGSDAKTSNYKELPEVNCNMASYIKMKEIFKESFNEKFEMIEKIILDITIFKDKTILTNRLKNLYHLDDEKIKAIKDLNYDGFCSLSRNLIDKIQAVDSETGEVRGTV